MKGDFERVLQEAKKGDLVYMDPPFAVRARRVFREYDPSTFTHEDISRLRSWMLKLNAARINFVVSYAESDEADVLRKNFSYETVSVRRNIAGFTGSRIPEDPAAHAYVKVHKSSSISSDALRSPLESTLRTLGHLGHIFYTKDRQLWLYYNFGSPSQWTVGRKHSDDHGNAAGE